MSNRRQLETKLDESEQCWRRTRGRQRRFGGKICDLQLSHEDTITVKDVEIARLKVCLLAITSPAAVSLWPVSGPSDHRVDETIWYHFSV